MQQPIMPNADGTLQCTGCKARKHTSQFFRESARKCGFSSRCRVCKNASTREHHARPEAKERQRLRDARADVREQKRKHHAWWIKTLEGKRWTLWHCAKVRAKAAGLPFTIAREDIVIPERCPLLDVPLFFGTIKKRANSPSLDRINPALGYVPGNVWIISFRANAIKQDASLPELELLVRNLARRIQDR